MNKDEVGPVLGRIPSGISILTAKNSEGAQTGMLASWIQQASFEPPAFTIAVNSKRYLNDWMTVGASVAVSLVGEGQKHLLGHFGKGFDPGEPAFSGLPTTLTPAGLSILTDSIGWLEGIVRGSLAAGDHIVYIVEITAGGRGDQLEVQAPFVHIRKNGFGY